MVKHVPIVEIRFGDHELTAVRHGSAPPGGSNGSTRVKFEVSASAEMPRIRAGSIDVDVDRGSGEIEFSAPLLGEDSSVDVYLRGPSPTVVNTEPLARSNQEIYRGRDLQHIRIAYRGSVGEVRWRWVTPLGVISISLECFPTKLDYKNDFSLIRAALQAVSPSLTTSVSGATTGLFESRTGSSQASDGEWLENLRYGLTDLCDAVHTLLPRLRNRVATELTTVSRDRVRRARPVSRYSHSGHRPNKPVQVQKLVNSINDPINGHLKWEILRLRTAASNIGNARWFEDIDENLSRPVEAVRQYTHEWLRALESVNPIEHIPNLHVRLRDPLYGRAFRALYALRDAITPLNEFRPIALKDLPTLYEYWVFLEVVTMLKRKYPTVLKGSSPLVQRAGPDLVLAQGRSSEIVLSDDSGNSVTCQYNRRYTGLPTTNQRPDAVIEVASEGRLLVVDAKYRLGRDSRYLRQYSIEGPLAEDINVLHRYRDAIVSPFPPHERLSSAGLIAFPGSNESQYRAHHFYRSWLAVRVGGIPLLPGRTQLMEEALGDFFSDISSKETV